MQQEKIQLTNQLTGVAHEFSFEHALRLLTQEKKRGFTSWNLPPDSKYLFKDGNIIIKPVRRGADRAEAKKEDREGKETRTENPDAHGSDIVG
jgi:hypothetical protein